MKKIVTLMALGSLSGAALAQSSVTLYGRVDVGYRWSSLGSPKFTQGSGQSTASRFGFRGTEELGQGLKARFLIETGISADTGTTALTGGLGGRQAYVSLGHASWGELRLGRVFALLEDQTAGYSPLGTSLYAYGTAGHILNEDQSRLNNGLSYHSPSFSGLSFKLQLGTREADSNGALANSSSVATTGKSRAHYAGALVYASGPVAVGLTLSKNYGRDAVLERNDEILAQLGGSYDLGVLKLFAQFERDDTKAGHGVAGSSSYGRKNAYLVGVNVPAGAWLFRAAAGRADNANRATSAIVRGKVTQFSLAAEYSLSKRTRLYVAAGLLKGDFDASSQRSPDRNAKTAITGFAHYF